MVKLKAFSVLEYHKFALTKLGIYRSASQNKNNVFFKSFVSYYVSIVLFTFIITGLAFVHENISDITIALRALVFIIGVIQALCMFHCYGIKVSKIKDVHIKLQEIIDEIVESNYSKNRMNINNLKI